MRGSSMQMVRHYTIPNLCPTGRRASNPPSENCTSPLNRVSMNLPGQQVTDQGEMGICNRGMHGIPPW